ncbi:MAG: TlyA family RNA methyltransferase [Acidobacteriota bacterium]
MKYERIDKLMVERGFVDSREKAKLLIMEGLVFSKAKRIEKASEKISTDENIFIKEKPSYISRAGIKLEGAIKHFNLNLKNRIAGDIGTSTGGFADVLIRNGVKKLYCIDVNFKQLDIRIRNNPAVILLQKNARYLTKDDFEYIPDFFTIDVSFISVKKILVPLREILQQGDILALIKPQFEAGRGKVGKDGVIKKNEILEDVLHDIINFSEKVEFIIKDLYESPILGQKGNREFFLYLCTHGKSNDEIFNKVKEIVFNGKN